MRNASIIFTVLGMVVNFLISPIFGAIGVAAGVWALYTLSQNKKSIACGVVAILFTGLLGGVFYLLWQPETAKKEENKEV